MFTRDDLADWIVASLAGEGGGQQSAASPARRVLLSDWELRRLRKPGDKVLRLPKGAIVSPLARDWIDFEGVKVVFE